MKQFLMVRDDALIVGAMWQPDMDDGPQLKPPSPVPDGVELIEYAGEFDRSAWPDAFVARLVDGVPAWSDPRTMDDLRVAKRDEINAAWIAADSRAFGYAGEQFRAGADDVLRLNSINGYISLMNEMPPGWIGVWKTMADTFIELPDVASWKPFYTAFVMKGVTNYLAAQGLKAQLAAATTAAAIAAITWPE